MEAIKSKEIGKEALIKLVRGACFMASAGGGTYTSGMNIATHFGNEDYYGEETKKVTVVPVDELDNEKYGVMVAYIGSPESMEEILYPTGIVNAVQEIEKRRNIKISYIVPPEIGAISMLAACTAAAQLNVAVIDGDGAGRAVPELSMTTFCLNNKDVNPVALSGQEGENTLYMELTGGLNKANYVEALIRPTLGLDCYGEKAGLAMWLVTGEELKNSIKSRNTISNCIDLGEIINGNNFSEIQEKVVEMGYSAEIIAEGSDMTIFTNVGGGFDRGTLRFIADRESTGSKKDDEINILFKNESLIAWNASQETPLVVAPDLISYLISFSDAESQWTYSNGDIQRISEGDIMEGHIQLIKLKAPQWMWDIENTLNQMQHSVDCNSSAVQKSYQNVLRSIGYYGKVCE